MDSNNNVLLNLDEMEVLIDFLNYEGDAADSKRQMVHTDKTIQHKYKKKFVNKMLKIKLESLEKWEEIIVSIGTISGFSVSTGKISGFSEKAVKELIDKLSKKIKV